MINRFRKNYLIVGIMFFTLICGFSFASASDTYPGKSIQVVVPWGAGGGTDTIARGFTPYIEEMLGESMVVTNKPGASGAIGGQFVAKEDPDGYTLLFGSETIALWELMDIADLDFKKFETLAIACQGVATLAVPASAQWQTIQEFIEYAQENPNQITMAATGPATTGSVALAILDDCLGIKVREIQYEGSGPATVAAIGGHVDVIMENLSVIIDQIRAGKLRVLAVFANERLEAVPEAPAIGELYPETSSYLPYGAWFGLFAPLGTPDDVLSILEDSISKAFKNPKWRESINSNYYIPVAVTGNEAREYVSKWQSNTAWLLENLGVAKNSPEELDIPKPGN